MVALTCSERVQEVLKGSEEEERAITAIPAWYPLWHLLHQAGWHPEDMSKLCCPHSAVQVCVLCTISRKTIVQDFVDMFFSPSLITKTLLNNRDNDFMQTVMVYKATAQRSTVLKLKCKSYIKKSCSNLQIYARSILNTFCNVMWLNHHNILMYNCWFYLYTN